MFAGGCSASGSYEVIETLPVSLILGNVIPVQFYIQVTIRKADFLGVENLLLEDESKSRPIFETKGKDKLEKLTGPSVQKNLKPSGL